MFLEGWSYTLRAEQVLVTGVRGQVLYGPGNSTPSQPLKSGQSLEAGTFSAGNDGIAYLTTFSGSELRLAESGTLRFFGTDLPGLSEMRGARPSDFQLLEGKLRVTIRASTGPPRFYRIDLARGRASVQSGQCVFCMHGDGAFVYVAHGLVLLANGRGGASSAPRLRVTGRNATYRAQDGAPLQPATALRGNGSVGVLGADGVFAVRPLSAVASGTQNCLLAGFNGDAAGGARHGSTADAAAAVVVSPTQ